MTVQFSKTDFFYHRFGLEMHTCRPFYHAISPKNTPDYHRTLLKDSLAQSDVAFDYVMADDQKGLMAGIPHPLWCCFMVWKAQAKVIMHAHWQVISLPKGGILWWRIFALVVVWRYRARCFIMLEIRLNWHIICKFYNSNLPQFMPSVYRFGGNALAKYMGEYGSDAIANRAVVVSAPVDLASASIAMERLLGRYIYTPYLLNPIIKKKR